MTDDRTGSKALGELQALVPSTLWDSTTALSVRDVLTCVKRKPPLACTTVLTVLTRLHEQGVVVRRKRGKAFYYQPRVSREQWMGVRAAHELAAGGDPPDQAVLGAFLDSAEQTDRALLDRLAALTAARHKGRAK